MDNQEISRLLYEAGVIRDGHFLRASGRHADHYVQCARLFERAKVAEPVCQALAERVRGFNAHLALSPAIGGVILCYEVGRLLGIRSLYTERKSGAMTLRRGFTVAPGSRVLILEDEVTTGSSVREVIEIVRALGGIVAGIGCIVDKSGGKVEFEYPFAPLVTVDVANYTETACPLCAEGKPLDRV